MNPIGVMQGRLSPPLNGKIQSFPVDSWEREFGIARDCGFEHIEWVFDVESAPESPLLFDDQLKRVKDIVSSTGVAIAAVCGDYFRDRPLIKASKSELSERMRVLRRLAEACQRIGIPAIMIPFVDNSAINNQEEFAAAVAALTEATQIVGAYGLQLSLETNLEPTEYRRLMEEVNHPGLKVNYDLGDCTSLGHDTNAELMLLAEWIVGVHVKDRKRGGSTVPLGEGDVDFQQSFKTLSTIGYTGPITLQTARSGDEIELARTNLEFVRSQLSANQNPESGETREN